MTQPLSQEVAYAMATVDPDKSKGSMEKTYKELRKKESPRGSGSGYVEFAQFQANDPEFSRKRAFNHESKKDLFLVAQIIRNFLRES